MRLKNKVVILTGAAQGIGEAIARLFVEEEARVILLDRQEDKLKKLSTELGGENCFYALDLTDKNAVKTMVNELREQFGRIDVLINNAGITRDALTAKMSETDWESVINVNLTAPFIITQEIFPLMKEQMSGVIINASSVSSLGNIGQANYAASKAGIIALTKTWALEFARYNIRVNAVAPGFTETPMVQTIPENIREKLTEKIPLRRFARPEELAKTYCFLASADSEYITGQTIFVDGGLTCGF